jgi:hypothetical protein
MTSFEKRAHEQLLQSAARIREKHPEECAEMRDRFCVLCAFSVVKYDNQCVYGLAPITSAMLPCPYYRI